MGRTLLLDLDGTLVDSVPDLTTCLNRLMAVRGLPPFDHAGVTALVGDGARAMVERAFAARGRPPDAAALAEFLADYTAHAAVESRLYPDVAATLGRLAGDGWGLAVCTNKPAAAARALLAALGLGERFAAIGGGDSFATRKPDPAHLLMTLELAGGSLARAVMVGDHHNDIAAAAAAGIPSIFAGWGYGAAEPGATAIAACFADVPVLATRLLA